MNKLTIKYLSLVLVLSSCCTSASQADTKSDNETKKAQFESKYEEMLNNVSGGNSVQSAERQEVGWKDVRALNNAVSKSCEAKSPPNDIGGANCTKALDEGLAKIADLEPKLEAVMNQQGFKSTAQQNAGTGQTAPAAPTATSDTRPRDIAAAASGAAAVAAGSTIAAKNPGIMDKLRTAKTKVMSFFKGKAKK